MMTMQLVLGRWVKVVRVAAAGAALTGCSALVDPDTRTLEPEPVLCSPGQVLTCLCDDGKPHSQRCNAGGDFEPCDCGSSATNAAAAGAGGDQERGAAGDR
jgi:hypothetical protein